MFAPLFRILSAFLIGIGLLGGTTGVYALVFRGDLTRFVSLLGIAVVMVLVGYKIREHAGELDLVTMSPEDLANSFEIPKALGLGANAAPVTSALAGGVAGAAIIVAVGLAGFITPGALLVAVLFFAVYGAALALIKRAALRRGALIKGPDGYYAAHRRVSQYAVPVILVTWLIASAPEANPLTLGLIVIGLFFWVGKAFHHVWDVSHTALLTLIYGEDRPKTIEWGLYEWLRHSRNDLELVSVAYLPESGEARVVGRFYRPDQLEREMRRLDFLKTVTLLPEESAGASR